jgi:putative methionine-R-sulfoxide reductase with GAF domain
LNVQLEAMILSSVPSIPKLVPIHRERRQHPRCRVLERGPISVDLGRARRGLLFDVSVGGASVEPYSVLEPGEVSRIRFVVPGKTNEFEAEGIIRWANASGRAGIKFLNPAASSTQCLRTWIDGLDQVSAGLPTQTSPHASAAYLPVSYSPWLKLKNLASTGVDDIEREIASLDVVSALRFVCDRARSLTRASGAAIALADGEDIVCRAHAGVAPDLGARFKPEAGLSGEAFRTAKTVLCADTNEDPRVDRAACNNLNIRSVLIVPIVADRISIGVIEVFSPQPNCFDERQLSKVQRFSQVIAAMLEAPEDNKLI